MDPFDLRLVLNSSAALVAAFVSCSSLGSDNKLSEGLQMGFDVDVSAAKVSF